MADIRDAANQLRAALEKISQVKNNPEAVQKAVDDAKTKVDQMAKQAEQ